MHSTAYLETSSSTTTPVNREAEDYGYIKSCWLDKKRQLLRLCNDLTTNTTDLQSWSH